MGKQLRRTKRKRRQARQAQKFGVTAKPTHKAFFGRTGQSMGRMSPSKKKFEFNTFVKNEKPISMYIYEVRKGGLVK
jgi:hypothetical protein